MSSQFKLGEITHVPYQIQEWKGVFTIIQIGTNKEIKKFTNLEEAEDYMWTNLVD
jgi:hypothetical protein